MVVTDSGKPRRIDVPVEIPAGLKGDVGEETETRQYINFALTASRAKAVRSRGGSGGIGRTPAPPPNNAPMVVSVDASPPEALSSVPRPEAQSAELQRKLHRSVLAVVQKLQKKEPLSSSDEAGFIRDGKAEVQVWLSDKSNESLAQLKELGFEVVLDAKGSNIIVGRLPIEKLEALAKLKFVRYVAPQR
jgi:hypothetical protein